MLYFTSTYWWKALLVHLLCLLFIPRLSSLCLIVYCELWVSAELADCDDPLCWQLSGGWHGPSPPPEPPAELARHANASPYSHCWVDLLFFWVLMVLLLLLINSACCQISRGGPTRAPIAPPQCSWHNGRHEYRERDTISSFLEAMEMSRVCGGRPRAPARAVSDDGCMLAIVHIKLSIRKNYTFEINVSVNSHFLSLP